MAHGADFDAGNQRGIGIGGDRAVDLVGDGLRQRTAFHGQFDPHPYVVRVGFACHWRGVNGCDHAQVGDGPAQFGVNHFA